MSLNFQYSSEIILVCGQRLRNQFNCCELNCCRSYCEIPLSVYLLRPEYTKKMSKRYKMSYIKWYIQCDSLKIRRFLGINNKLLYQLISKCNGNLYIFLEYSEWLEQIKKKIKHFSIYMLSQKALNKRSSAAEGISAFCIY